MTWGEFCDVMAAACSAGERLDGVIVFAASNWEEAYTLEARSYKVCSLSKYFTPFFLQGDDPLIGSALDGSDDDVRLDYYLPTWEVEYCYTV